MSKKLSGVLRILKLKVIAVWEDQHSSGLHFGSVGYLLQKKEEKNEVLTGQVRKHNLPVFGQRHQPSQQS